MKVICISEGIYDEPGIPEIKEGQTYTVKSERRDEVGRDVYYAYTLVEFGDSWAYGIGNFIPLSNIDETTLERTFEKPLTRIL